MFVYIQNHIGKQCLCTHKHEKTPEPQTAERVLFSGLLELCPNPRADRMSWVTLLLAVATQFCKSLIRLITLHIWVIGLSSFYFGICAGDHYGNTYVIPIHILTTRKQQLAVYETFFCRYLSGNANSAKGQEREQKCYFCRQLNLNFGVWNTSRQGSQKWLKNRLRCN